MTARIRIRVKAWRIPNQDCFDDRGLLTRDGYRRRNLREGRISLLDNLADLGLTLADVA